MALRDRVLKRRELIFFLGVAAALFLADVVLSWHAMERGITFEYYWPLIKPFEAFLAGNHLGLQPPAGNPAVMIYMFPIFLLTGLTVATATAVNLVFHGLAAAILFLALAKAFDWWTGFGASLVLLSTTFFISFRPPELPLLWFLNSTLLYLFVYWWDTHESKYLYGMAAVTGFGAYVKILMLFPAAALMVAALIVERSRIVKFLSLKGVALGSILFAAAYSLPLISSLYTGLVSRSGALTLQFDGSFVPKVGGRIENLSELLRVEPSVWAPLSDMYTALFLLGVFLILRYRRDMQYLVAAVVVFILAVFSPTNYAAPHHLSVIYPFLLAVIAQALYYTPRKVSMSLLSGIILVFGATAVFLIAAPPADDRGGLEGYITISDSKTVREQNLSGSLATNHAHFFITAALNPQITQRYVIAPQTPQINLLWDGQGYLPPGARIPNNEAYISLNDLGRLYHERNGTLALIDGDNCPVAAEHADAQPPYFCGFKTSTVINTLDLNRTAAASLHLGGVDYLLFG